jgi:CspA family cold shock protein
MVQATVKFFNQQGSYGFLAIDDPEDTDEDEDEVFFHMADISGPDLAEGQNAEFEIEQSDKGPRAANLTRLDEDGEPMEVEQESSRDDDVLVDDQGNRWVSINDM